jgi:hypothetical protein
VAQKRTAIETFNLFRKRGENDKRDLKALLESDGKGCFKVWKNMFD